ncbi:MAG: hypothetical protein OXH71_04800, partial [Candidatus Dadabacteria bacterium]|nr:hypothetical protein [Candidatus Dadabacteria bacterium]
MGYIVFNRRQIRKQVPKERLALSRKIRISDISMLRFQTVKVGTILFAISEWALRTKSPLISRKR